MTRKLFIVGLSVFVVAALTVPSMAGNAGKKKGGIRGKVTALDKDKNTISIETGKKGAKEMKTFEIAKDAKVMVEDKEGKMEDVKVGMRVQVTSTDGKTATAIAAGPAKKKKKTN